MEITSMPVELDEAERRIMQLEIEREALRKERDDASQRRLAALEQDLANFKEERDALRSKWDQERQAILAISELRDEIDRVRVEMEQAQRAYDYNRAAELQYGTMKQLEEQIREQEQALARLQSSGKLLKEEVDSDDIADVVSRWTGIPVSRLMEGEIEKLVHMEERLHQRVVGQDEAAAAHGQVSQTRTGLRAASSSSVPPALGKPSWRGPSRNSCSIRTTRWCGSICLSTWSGTPSAA
jgi:ATP-dependent Clp protease ATP-binding subunit ClpB